VPAPVEAAETSRPGDYPAARRLYAPHFAGDGYVAISQDRVRRFRDDVRYGLLASIESRSCPALPAVFDIRHQHGDNQSLLAIVL